MITDTVDVFPINIIKVMAVRLKSIDPDLTVVMRSLRDSDGTQTIGVFPLNWQPDDTTREIGAREPTIQRYPIAVQSFVKDTDEEQGIRVHGILAKRVRSLLYRDAQLAIGLNALSVSMDGGTERIQRRGVTLQRYLDGQSGAVFMYLATLEYFVETETI